MPWAQGALPAKAAAPWHPTLPAHLAPALCRAVGSFQNRGSPGQWCSWRGAAGERVCRGVLGAGREPPAERGGGFGAAPASASAPVPVLAPKQSWQQMCRQETGTAAGWEERQHVALAATCLQATWPRPKNNAWVTLQAFRRHRAEGRGGSGLGGVPPARAMRSVQSSGSPLTPPWR